jgi:capsular polysaccharide transport system permease protein
MSATLVTLRGAAASVVGGASPTAPATATGLVEPAAGGQLAVVHNGELAPDRTARARRLPLTLLSFLLVVALPTVAAGAYYFLIAADQYVAEFRFGLRSSEPIRADTGTLLPGSAAPLQTVIDSYAVAQYIASRAIVDDLGQTLDLRRMFSTKRADWPARLHLPVSIEELIVYWQRQIDAFFDPINGTIVVRARAFTPGDALTLAQGILNSSERLVNDLSTRARQDALRNSQRDVSTAEQRLTTALSSLREFRDKEGLIDPHKAADANSALDGRLRDELVRAATNLATLKGYLSDNSPTLRIIEARIQALKAQQAAIESEATDTAKTHFETLSRVMGSYEELESERHFAETAYQHALEALDRARMNADRQQIYVADFVPPSLPEEPLYPRRLRSVGIVFVAAFVTWAIGGLTVRSVRDHL